MLYNLNWLTPGSQFPPLIERPRLERYAQNEALFNNEHFAVGTFRHRNGLNPHSIGVYDDCCKRISQVIGNFQDVVAVPVLLNYQRFLSMKMADLVAGEHPSITGSNEQENAKIKWINDKTDFFAKLYAIVIDLSRYGDVPIRVFKDTDGYYTFCVWDANGWYPIVSQDGTYRITKHCLCWTVDEKADANDPLVHDWYLHVQIHDVEKPGEYEEVIYHNGSNMNVIGPEVSRKKYSTGLSMCAVFSVRAFDVSGTVYGYDDYVPLDAILSEIIARVSQISIILDKHADPSMTGPVSMLDIDPKTGERYLRRSKFYGVNPEDTPPSYLVWNGELNAAFNQLEFLINQLFILSEMGAALTGGTDGASNSVSGTAMRFKMVNPLAKARRVSNSLTKPVRQLYAMIGSGLPEIDESTGEPGSGEDTPLPYSHISVQWKDGLPDDPREQIENCKLATGEERLIPLEQGLMLYFNRSEADAKNIVELVRKSQEEAMERNAKFSQQTEPVNTPGPQNGKGVNPQRKGGKVKNFQSENNKKSEDK